MTLKKRKIFTSLYNTVLLHLSFWFPIFLFELLSNNKIQNTVANIVSALAILLFSNLSSNKKLNLILETVGACVFNFILFIQIAHQHLFNDHIKSSTFYIIFDSNSSESLDFLCVYFDRTLVFILISLILALIVGISQRYKQDKHQISFKSNIVFFLIILISLSFYEIRSATFPHILKRSIIAYKEDKEKLNRFTQDNVGGIFSNVKHESKTEKETYVLVIGESTARSHMQLYDYYRKTNPKLQLIKDDLIIYNDVISPHTHTITSLEKVLTLANNEDPNKKFDGTLVQLFNKAGFKTYWLSNQQPMGIHQTVATIISRNCHEQIFVNTTDKSLDGNLLYPFKKVLKESFDKKFIIVHLMGTHFAYNNRYPKDFETFNTEPITQFKHDKAYKAINEYDNAVLYNDFILSTLIEQLRKTETTSYLLYFSDHGEDVFETNNSMGHFEDNGTKPMYDIPFILWQSNQYKKENQKFIFDISRKYSTEDVIHTISDLSNLYFKEFDATRSIINIDFEEKKRIILKDKDYDVYFDKKN